MMYEERRAAVPNDAMALNATVLPILMRDKRHVMQKETKTALTGISRPGLTYIFIRGVNKFIK